MKNHLHHIAIRIPAIETPGPISMCPWRLEYFYVVAEQEIVPGVNILKLRQNEAKMIQVL